MERRREGMAAIWVLPAALMVTALVVWLLWSVTSGKNPDISYERSVLVSAEREEPAHG